METPPVVYAEVKNPSPTPAPAPVADQRPISHLEERHQQLLAETVEEVDDAAWKEHTNDQDDAWKEEEEATDHYAQDNPQLETAGLEENGSGYVAVALYDYQASADDELSFDPDDIITNIEMVFFLLFQRRAIQHVLFISD